ncbi:MAG: YqaA family protein [Gammaproteobacteria bacterium]
MSDGALGLSGLFISSFISSTVAPGGSEAVLALMVAENTYQISMLVIIATLGNTLGALTTWYLGYLAASKYPVETLLSQKKQNAVIWVKKWGRWALLLSWLPVVGDGFCFAGGWLRFSIFSSTIFILIGKLGRYSAIAWIFAGS